MRPFAPWGDGGGDGGERAPEFDIDHVVVDGDEVAVRAHVTLDRPFQRLIHFAVERPLRQKPRPPVLLVAPISSNAPYVLRDTVLGLSPWLDVHVLAWRDARLVPVADGPFGFDESVGEVLLAARALGPRPHVIGLCQSVAPCLTAAALAHQGGDDSRPASLTLIAGPVDSRINPSRVAELIRRHSLDWLNDNIIDRVPRGHPGAGRRVYAADSQRAGLTAYVTRHIASGGEIARKFVHDDGVDPATHPFSRHFWSLIDVAAEVFLETMERVFINPALPTGAMTWRGVRVEPHAIADMGLLTVEGADDDIAPLGETEAAHALLPGVASDRRARHVQPGVGHFGTFHGLSWRRDIAPKIAGFIDQQR